MKRSFICLILMISTSVLFGQTLYYVDGPNGTDDGLHGTTSGSGAWASIQYAINNVTDPTTATIVINVAAGTYTESVTIDRSFNSLAIVGASSTTTILQAHADPNTATTGVFTVIGNSSNLNDEVITLQNLTIRNGVVFSGSPPNVNFGGGGILNEFATLSIQNSTISNCKGDYGGGIYSSGTLTMENSTLHNNSSYAGANAGAIWSTGLLVITNSTLSNNVAGYGGAISFRGSLVLTNCTIANNNSTTGYGDGVYLDQGAVDLILKNTIIANNGDTANDYELYRYDGTVTSNGYNVVGYYAGTGVSITSLGDWTDQDDNGTFDLASSSTTSSTLNLSTTLADNNTSNGTQTLALTSGSFAINNGNSSNNGSIPIPTTDQRGAARIGTVDIGAYEYYDDSGSLPVELTFFKASIFNKNIVLDWITATEVNNFGFEIEASTSSANVWETIGFVEGHGNSNSPKEYSFVASTGSAPNVSFRLKQIDTDGSFEYSDVVTVEVDLANEFKLTQNYPNPFNPTTSINFTIPKEGFVTLRVYNTIGEEVANLLNKNINAGSHNIVFDATNLPNGAYFYRIKANNFSETKKMLLLK